MKQYILILTLFIYTYSFSQNTIHADYVATYMIKYNYSGVEAKEQTLLFMNATKGESLYVGTNLYVLDSLISNGRVSSNPLEQSAYDSHFNEIIHNKNNQLSIYEKVSDLNVFYKETPNIKWNITNDTKIYNNVKVTKAYATVFGRKWIAWFTDNNLAFGPYKFVGLPGLILYMKDENNEFSIKLRQLKKKDKIVSVPNPNRYKKIKKKQLEKIRYSEVVLDVLNSIIHKNPRDKREWREGLEESFNNYPRLDIEYPYQP